MEFPGKTYNVSVPKTRDPFVNTRLIKAGIDKRTGRERFWTSTYNANMGCTGVTVDEWGNADIVKFGSSHSGFYSAIYEGDDNKLWLCGFLNNVCSLDMNTGKFDCFKTNGSRALVFQGMPYDKETNRLFAAASTPPVTEGFVFDTKHKKTVKTYKDAWKHKYIRNSFSNGDGTYTIIINTPGVGFYNWDPKTCKITLKQSFPHHDPAAKAGSSLIINDDNQLYVPNKGWYDPIENEFKDGIKPEEEATWIKYDKENNNIYGGINVGTNCTIVRWNTLTGKVTRLYTIEYGATRLLQFTEDNTAIAINMYGYFYRIDLKNQCLESCSRLNTNEYGHTDCIKRVDDNTLLGTPFITQRFWTVDLKTGKGKDCGRVVSSGGQVNLTWNIDNKIYMASYTSGELAKYDPTLPVFYPENPYVVVKPPKPAMRPVGGADDGRTIYYTCNNEYGLPGCMLIKYDTKTNQSSYTKDVLPGQQIRNLFYDNENKILIGGSTAEGDCGSYTPDSYDCYFATLDPKSLTVTKTKQAAKGTKYAHVIGLLGNFKALIRHNDKTTNIWNYKDNTYENISFFKDKFEKLNGFSPTKKPGYFVVLMDTDLELWNLSENKKIKTIAQGVDKARLIVDNVHIYLHAGNNITVLDYALKGLL